MMIGWWWWWWWWIIDDDDDDHDDDDDDNDGDDDDDDDDDDFDDDDYNGNDTDNDDDNDNDDDDIKTLVTLFHQQSTNRFLQIPFFIFYVHLFDIDSIVLIWYCTFTVSVTDYHWQLSLPWSRGDYN